MKTNDVCKSRPAKQCLGLGLVLFAFQAMAALPDFERFSPGSVPGTVPVGDEKANLQDPAANFLRVARPTTLFLPARPATPDEDGDGGLAVQSFGSSLAAIPVDEDTPDDLVKEFLAFSQPCRGPLDKGCYRIIDGGFAAIDQEATGLYLHLSSVDGEISDLYMAAIDEEADQLVLAVSDDGLPPGWDWIPR